MTEPRTVTLLTEDHGNVTIPEPSWCVGHADHRPDTYRVDLDHKGPEHRLTHDGDLLWTAFLGQAPHSTSPQARALGVFVEQGRYARTLNATELYDLAATFDAHADRLRELADQLAGLLEEEQR
ncbi:hypothetical protein HLK59_10135 [Streptomyces sp. S3(2020)]|uniref:DUF6907 domain-containing protein n=1 Tax=Streptomyces sp. S3(2020) TaxID=2732044 RepID=UPI00148927D1|nr:hypothetical protein [Streptomyces sp. S3(2020)]NNN30715.1 hypothetical protein [Streptomyces sp. S3(2020)]